MTASTSVCRVRVHQALYGEKRGGHSLLAASSDECPALDVVQRLDLPDTAPQGVEWSPFLRGFPHEEWYVLSRTFRDTESSRAGMVFSHALFAPLDQIVALADMRTLINALASSDLNRPGAEPLDLVLSTGGPLNRSDELLPTAWSLATSGQLPVVRLGHDGFDDLIAALWAQLLPDIRRKFAFRLSFSPRDVVETPTPAVVCTPQSMAARWSDHTVIRSNFPSGDDSLVAALLGGDARAERFQNFMEGVGARPSSFRDLQLMEKAYGLVHADPTLERRTSAIRLIDALSPDPTRGQGAKDALLAEVCTLLLSAFPNEVLLLRNLNVSAFANVGQLWPALRKWAGSNPYPRGQDAEVLAVLADATTETAAIWPWRAAILAGVVDAICAPRAAVLEAFWRWLAARSEVALAVFAQFADHRKLDKSFARSAPSEIETQVADTFASSLADGGWPVTQGAILAAAYEPLEAVRKYLAEEAIQSEVDGLDAALRHATPSQLIQAALEIDDSRLLGIASKAVAKNPRLISVLDISTNRVQAIWRDAIGIDTECWRGPLDPTATLHRLLDALLDGEHPDMQLITVLSRTPLADIGRYHRRQEIWPHLSGLARENMLATTADKWLRGLSEGTVPFPPEPDLQGAIHSSSQLDEVLAALIPTRLALAVRAVGCLQIYDEGRFLELLDHIFSSIRRIPASDAKTVGDLICERAWANAADALVTLYRAGRSDAKGALRACYALLPAWEQFSLELIPIPVGEKWRMLESVAVGLYPKGPDEDELWERAGGSNADLLAGGSGSTRWNRALRGVRRGKRPLPSEILDTIQKDYPNNVEVLHLASDSLFRPLRPTRKNRRRRRFGM